MGTAEMIAGATFLVVVLLVVGPYLLLVVRPESANRDMLLQRIKTGGGAASSGLSGITGKGLLKDAERLSVIGPLNKALSGSGAMAVNLRNLVHMSGVTVTPGQFVLGSACLALMTYFLVIMWVPQPALALTAGLLMGGLPYVALRFLRARRLNKFEEQFPEAVDLISRTLRAGHALATGLRMVADEIPEPIATEFKLLHDQQNYGLPLSDGLRAFAKRVPLIDARFFVTAVLTQREAGGNLAEVLDNLSAVIRERFKIKRQLRVISAHGRLTGAVLGALPPTLGIFLMIRTPENFRILFEDPAGIRMLIVAVMLQLLGAFMIYRITKVDY
ncbi:MAG: type II secretion system F family protein [Vicinamibacterales bacterium]